MQRVLRAPLGGRRLTRPDQHQHCASCSIVHTPLRRRIAGAVKEEEGRTGRNVSVPARGLATSSQSSSSPESPPSTTALTQMEDLQALVALLPDSVRSILEKHPDLPKLVEVVMDLGRPPLARFPEGDVQLSSLPMTPEDLDQAVEQVGDFSGDNRAGINQTLHRISCMRNRAGRIVGLTCRVGRVIEGSAAMVEDLIKGGRSILLLGRPGVGKTTAIRDISCMLADKLKKRTVIVDTSNEIGGDGDVPHPGIGDARRMQVPCPEEQHRVMQEAVENHMPQAIIIDEIGTEAECMAARTISQRGLQLVATAHGNALENVIKNPALNLLVGGIQSVTLGDDAAKRRGVQKSVLERAGPPTFDVCVEMIERHRWRVHSDVGSAVDAILAGGEATAQMRERDPASGKVRDITFKGIVRRADEHGEVQSWECWVASDGEELLRAVAPAQPKQAPAFPHLAPPASGSDSRGSLTPASSLGSSSSGGSNGSGSSGGGGGGGAVAVRAAGDAQTAVNAGRVDWSGAGSQERRSYDSQSPPVRRPLPSLLVVPGPPPEATTTAAANNLEITDAAKLAAAAAAAAAVAAAKAKILGGEQQAGPRPPPDSWPQPAEAPASRTSAGSEQGASWGELEGPEESGPQQGAPAEGEAGAVWPSAAAAAAKLPVVMPTPVLDTRNAGAVAPAATAASPRTAAPPSGSEAEPAATEAAPGRAAGGPGGMRVYLFMDDESAAKVQQTLSLLASAPTVVMTQDLAAAHIVVATRSKLRSSPKMKSVVRKMGKPIYALRSTSSSGIYRDLCPLLGLDPLASGDEGGGELEVYRSSMEEEADAPSASPAAAAAAAAVAAAAAAPLNGRGRADLTSADDYAQLMDNTVRELRYAPIDRDYSAQVLDSFLGELAPSASGRLEGGCSAWSLASMVWGLSHTKHKRKFVEAKRAALLSLALQCEGRWAEFSSRDLLRLALGMARLRLAPSAAWVEELAVRCKAGIASAEYATEQVERLTAAIYTMEALLVPELEAAQA